MTTQKGISTAGTALTAYFNITSFQKSWTIPLKVKINKSCKARFVNEQRLIASLGKEKCLMIHTGCVFPRHLRLFHCFFYLKRIQCRLFIWTRWQNRGRWQSSLLKYYSLTVEVFLHLITLTYPNHFPSF